MKNIYQEIVNETAFCKTHPTGKVGRRNGNRWFETCYVGYIKKRFGENVKCEIVIERK